MQDAANWDRIWEVFHSALERSPETRASFVDTACGSEPELRGRVLELLGCHESAADFLDAPPESLLEDVQREILAADIRPGDQIGPYRIERLIGEGGMGVVFAALQEQPVRRTVALKVIHLGMATKDVLARFEAERQALALMNHSNIAQVYDAGSTETGQPFFVMEYVDGEPVTTYCDRHRLNVDERLEIFLGVCDGLQHAHQKGVIHRDIKPTNVLVTLENDKPVPKIIDFGVAKATGEKLTEETLYTRLNTIVGTTDYMSPEQAGLAGSDIDTRADVYSLNVLLYELLVGVTPFESTAQGNARQLEMLRMIRDQEPTRPSARLARLTEEAAERTSRSRRTTTRALHKRLGGDVAWITMKGMEKDRDRRYATVAELSADLRRYVDGLPVVARAPSTGYRAAKFARRHKVGVAISTAVLVMIVAFSVFITAQSIRLQQALDDTVQERNRAQEITSFLLDLFGRARPVTAEQADMTVREMLDEGAGQLRTELDDQPELRATLLTTMGGAYRELENFETAEELLQQALIDFRASTGEDSTEVARVLNALGEIRHDTGDFEAAESFYRQAAEIHAHIPGLTADESNAVYNLAVVMVDLGKPEQAKPLAEQGLQMREQVFGEISMQAAEAMQNLGYVHTTLGDLELADRLTTEAIEIYRAVLPADHIAIGTALNYYATVLRRLGRNDDARIALEEAAEIYRATYGEDHWYVAATLNNLSLVLNQLGRYQESRGHLEEALRIVLTSLGEDHPRTATTRLNLAATLTHLEQYAEAERLLRQVVAADRAALGNEHPDLAASLDQLGVVVLQAGGDPEESEALHREAISIRTNALGEEHPDIAASRHNLAMALSKQGRTSEAEAEIEYALEIARANHSQDHPRMIRYLLGQGAIAAASGDSATARSAYESALTAQRATLGDDHPDTRKTVDLIASIDQQAVE